MQPVTYQEIGTLQVVLTAPGSISITEIIWQTLGVDCTRPTNEDRAMTDHIIIDDGQFRYPVRRADLRPQDTLSALQAMSGDEYSEWCQQVPMDSSHGDAGTAECIEYCDALEADGAEIWHI